MRKLTSILIVLFSVLVCGHAQPATTPWYAHHTWDAVANSINETMQKNHVVGMSVAVLDDQRVVWARGFGYADAAKKGRATPTTAYRIGSISKLFVATAVMQLAEQGRVDIDAPLQTYLPEFAMKSRFSGDGPITPRNVMSHHAGLPTDWMHGMFDAKPTSFTEYPTLLHDEYPCFPTNTVFCYSNVGYGLLGDMIQHVTGQPFEAYMDKNLLHPLWMDHASFALRPDVAERLSKGYREGKEYDEPPLGNVPAGNLHASVRDMCRFMAMVLGDGRYRGRQILKPETLAEMLRPQNEDIPLDLDFRIGLGWILPPAMAITGYDGPVYGHDGATLVYNSEMALLPAEKLGVVVLSNSAEGMAAGADILAQVCRTALEAKTGKPLPAPTKPPLPKPISLSPDAAQAITGTYASALDPIVRITQRGNRLFTRAAGARLELMPRSGGWFTLRAQPIFGLFRVSLGELGQMLFSFQTIAGHDVMVLRAGSVEQVVGERVRPTPISAAWKQRLGTYHVTNPDSIVSAKTPINLKEENGFLVLRAKVLDEEASWALSPLNDHEAIVLGLGRDEGGTVRVERTDQGEVLCYSGYRCVRDKPAPK